MMRLNFYLYAFSFLALFPQTWSQDTSYKPRGKTNRRESPFFLLLFINQILFFQKMYFKINLFILKYIFLF